MLKLKTQFLGCHLHIESTDQQKADFTDKFLEMLFNEHIAKKFEEAKARNIVGEIHETAKLKWQILEKIAPVNQDSEVMKRVEQAKRGEFVKGPDLEADSKFCDELDD